MRLTAPLPLFAVLLATAFAGAPQLAAAQEVSSVLEGQVDGEPMTWNIIDIGGESGSYWADMGTLHQVTVFAFADDGAENGLRPDGAVEFSLTLDSREDPMRVVAAQVTFFPEEDPQPYGVPRRAETLVEVDLEATEIDGGQMHLRGRLATPLQRLVDADAQQFDAEDTIDIEVSFDLTVGRL